jgi:hypothetical protein
MAWSETEDTMASQIEKDCTIMAYLLRDKEGHLYHVELEDTSELSLIFKLDKDLVEQGLFHSVFIDSRDFNDMGLELIWVLEPPDAEH